MSRPIGAPGTPCDSYVLTEQLGLRAPASPALCASFLALQASDTSFLQSRSNKVALYVLWCCWSVILSPRARAMPCVLDRMRMWPSSVPAPVFSTLMLTSASSPKTLRA